MKIKILKKSLLDGVVISEKITGKKESLPVLSCILFDAQKELIIRATNLEASIEVVIPCEIEERGLIAVPAGIISQTLRSINSDKVSLYTEEGNLYIESKGTKTLIKAIPHEEFPTFSSINNNSTPIKIQKNLFLKGIQSVSYAASPSMIRPELGSVYFSIKSTGVLCAATDSFRLAEKNIPRGAAGDLGDILIPLKHISEVIYILDKIHADSIDLILEDSQLIISGEGVRYTSRIVDANFPDYKVIIPKTATTEVVVLKNDLVDLMRKARVFAGTNQHIGLHVYPKKKIFSATARSNDVGEMSDTLDAALSGEDLDINFHIGYIAECLPVIESDSVTLSFAGVGKPLVIRGVGEASFMYLVMPLNK